MKRTTLALMLGIGLTTTMFSIVYGALFRGSIVNLSSIYGSMAPRFDVYAGTAMTMPVGVVTDASASPIAGMLVEPVTP